MSRATKPIGTFVVVSLALFMTTLDNLVVSTALPNIRASLGADLADLQWTVNAYTLAFAVLLLMGAALGDRFGRKRVFLAGLVVFTTASAAAALSQTPDQLIVARAIQGLGAAVVLPLTLTLLSAALPPERKAVAIGAWSGIGGLGVALGPVVGGALVNAASWHWIFWLNVPIGVLLVPAAGVILRESYGPHKQLDTVGVALSGAGAFGIVYGLVRAEALGWTNATILGSLITGTILIAAFCLWEHRQTALALPMQFFARRSFSTVITANVLMYFGVFGSIFLLSQYFQTAQGYSALEAGLRTLPWTMAPMFISPLAGALSNRIGARPLISTGLALQGIGLVWTSRVSEVTTPYSDLWMPLMTSGIGMALVFAPAATAVLASVRSEQEGQASGALNSLREIGGVLGVAILAAVFSANGGYADAETFVDGMRPAVLTGGLVLIAGAALALLIPGRLGATETNPLRVSEHLGS